MKRLIQSENGSVSIFLIIILITVFFFNAVLIDYARVMVAIKQTEAMKKAAIRSIMSAYDTPLFEQYGLFATKVDGKREFYQRIIEKNAEQTAAYFHYAKPKLDPASLSLNAERTLAEDEIISGQMIEEMKYKAPIQFTLEVIDTFKPIALNLGQSMSTLKNLMDIKELYEEREKELNQILNIQNGAFQGIQQDFSRLSEENLKSLEQPVQAHTDSLMQAVEAVKNAREINNRMKEVLYRSNVEEASYQQVFHDRSVSDPVQADQENLEELQVVQNAMLKLILADSFFDQLEARMEEQQQLLSSIEELLPRFNSTYPHEIELSPSGSPESAQVSRNMQQSNSVREDFNRVIQRYNVQTKLLIEAQTTMIREQQESRERSKKLEDQYNQEADAALQTIKEWLAALDSDKEKREGFQHVDQLVQFYSEYNVQIGEEGEVDSQIGEESEESEEGGQNGEEDRKNRTSLDKNKEDVAEDAISIMNRFFGSLEDHLHTMRDQLYTNEYVMERFTSFDPAQFKGMTMENMKDFPAIFPIKNQEIEYILYGFESPVANLSTAFSEIFALRMAVNTVHAFTYCARTGHPLAVLACVLEKSIKDSVQDMKQLLSGRKISPFQRSQMNVDYRNHLRYILFTHPGSKRIYRIQALIHYRLGKELSTYPTYFEAKGDMFIRLWFLPEIVKILEYTRSDQNRIEDERYIIRRKVVYSYE